MECLAFVDALVAEDRLCTVVIADTYSYPGGWLNTAPSFARLSSCCADFGVLSEKLGKAASTEGASQVEFLVHFDRVMGSLLETGRVRYFPKCRVNEDCTCVTSVLDADCCYAVHVRRKAVDAAGARHCKLHRFEVATGVKVVLPSQLPHLRSPHPSYMVLGAGQFAVDTVLWLLSSGVSPDKVSWARPCEMWYHRSEAFLPEGLAKVILKILASQAECPSLESLHRKLEEAGIICRIDSTSTPRACVRACVTHKELTLLRKVRNVIKLGRVLGILEGCMILDGGMVETTLGTLFIDCTGAVIGSQPQSVRLWNGRHIAVQPIWEANVFREGSSLSAALMGMLEGRYPEDEALKNFLCGVPSSDVPSGTVRGHTAETRAHLWRESDLNLWLHASSLNPLANLSALEFQILTRHIGELKDAARENMTSLARAHGEAIRAAALPSVASVGKGGLCGVCGVSCTATSLTAMVAESDAAGHSFCFGGQSAVRRL